VGSDTGGSIRARRLLRHDRLKPTYGLVSAGACSAVDHARPLRPLSWTVEDSAIACRSSPATTRSILPASIVPCRLLDGLAHGVEGLRIGLPRHFFAEAQDVRPRSLQRSIEPRRRRKARRGGRQITLPDYDLFNACGRSSCSRAFAIHEQDYRGDHSISSADILRMTLGASSPRRSSSGDAVARELSQAVNLQLKTYDALITASALAPAPAFADIDPKAADWPIQTMPFNVTGNPRCRFRPASPRRVCRCRCRSSPRFDERRASHRRPLRIRDGLSARARRSLKARACCFYRNRDSNGSLFGRLGDQARRTFQNSGRPEQPQLLLVASLVEDASGT